MMRWDIVALEAEFRDTHKKITQLSKRPSSRYLYQFFVFKINIINISNHLFMSIYVNFINFCLCFFRGHSAWYRRKMSSQKSPILATRFEYFEKLILKFFIAWKLYFEMKFEGLVGYVLVLLVNLLIRENFQKIRNFKISKCKKIFENSKNLNFKTQEIF